MEHNDPFDWRGKARRAHDEAPRRARRPVVGITAHMGADGSCQLAPGYWRSVAAAGAVPVLLPPLGDAAAMASALERVDAVVLSGGGDIHPLMLGEEPSPRLHGVCPERDMAELQLASMALDMQMPVLGICYGMQVATVALGGSVAQDLGDAAGRVMHTQTMPREWPCHTVTLAQGSRLASIMGTERTAVNSFHHQAVDHCGPHLRVTATAEDGVVEAVESAEGKPVVGVQWHPEAFVLRGDESMMPLFRWLADEARLWHRTRQLHRTALTLDSHCDTPMKFHTADEPLVTLPRMERGDMDAVFMVAYLPQGGRTDDELTRATAQADTLLDEIEQWAQENGVALAATPDEVREARRQGRHCVVKGIENGYALGKDTANVGHFRERGVAYVTLCHNGDNDLCDSARGQGEHGGLSPLGRQMIEEMNRKGVMVDLSHAAETTFWDALRASRTPLLCSHSSCRALCDHPRNLTDEQMRQLAVSGGVMQVTLYEGFLRSDGAATVTDAVNHIMHAVKVMGTDHVGIGSDFDGDGGVPGVAHTGEMMNLTRELLRAGLTEEQLRGLWGGNLMALWQRVLDEADE